MIVSNNMTVRNIILITFSLLAIVIAFIYLLRVRYSALKALYIPCVDTTRHMISIPWTNWNDNSDHDETNDDRKESDGKVDMVLKRLHISISTLVTTLVNILTKQIRSMRETNDVVSRRSLRNDRAKINNTKTEESMAQRDKKSNIISKKPDNSVSIVSLDNNLLINPVSYSVDTKSNNNDVLRADMTISESEYVNEEQKQSAVLPIRTLNESVSITSDKKEKTLVEDNFVELANIMNVDDTSENNSETLSTSSRLTLVGDSDLTNDDATMADSTISVNNEFISDRMTTAELMTNSSESDISDIAVI